MVKLIQDLKLFDVRQKKAKFQFKNFTEVANFRFDPTKLAFVSVDWSSLQLNAYVKGRNGGSPFKVSL